jgi:hypothetical protein
MAEIDVASQGSDKYSVTVNEGGQETTHEVTIPTSFLSDRLKLESVDPEKVVRESFAFLLEREPQSSIMSSFSLDVISRYFPEYEEEMPRRLGG